MPEKIFWKEPLFWFAFLIGGFFLSLCLWYGPGMNESYVCYLVWVWKNYHLPPSVGAFTGDSPGIYLIGWLAFELFGDRFISLRIMDLLIQLTCLPMIFYLTKRASGSRIAAFISTACYGLFYYGLSMDNTAHRETFILWLLFACVTFSFALGKRVWSRASLVGLMLGMVFLLKPTYGLAWPVFGLLFLIEGFVQKRKMVIPELLLFSAACFCAPAMIALYYWRLGYLDMLIFANLTFNAQVYSRMIDPAVQMHIFWAEKLPEIIFKLYPLPVFSAAFIIAFQLFKSKAAKDPKLFQTLLAMLLVGMINYRMQGKYFLYHIVPFAGFTLIFSGWAFGQIIEWVGEKNNPQTTKAAATAICVAVLTAQFFSIGPRLTKFAVKYAFRNDFEKAYLVKSAHPKKPTITANYYEVVHYLQPIMRPGDQIALFGPHPLIPFLLKQKLPTYICFVQCLLFYRYDGEVLPVQEELIREFSSEVIHARPRFFIFSDNFTVSNNPLFHLMNTDAWLALDQQFPDLKKFIEQNYKLRTIIGVVYIYELQPAQEP